MKRLVLLLLVPPLLLSLCALAILWTPLPSSFPSAGGDLRNRTAAMAAGILGLAYLVGVSAYPIWLARKAARTLADVLVPVGLTSGPHLVVGRRYRGMIGGRAIEVTFVPAHGITRCLLNLSVSADLGMRLAAGRQRPLLDCRNCTRVDSRGSGLEDLYVVAEDSESARRLLARPEVSEALKRLLSGQGAGIREVYMQPRRVWLRARPGIVTAEGVASWLEDLRTLAQIGEGSLASSGG